MKKKTFFVQSENFKEKKVSVFSFGSRRKIIGFFLKAMDYSGRYSKTIKRFFPFETRLTLHMNGTMIL